MNEMLHSHRDGAVLCLTLHRPAAANALHSAMAGALMTALTAATLDDGIGAVVLSGAGERVFCAGADLKEHSELEQGAAALLRRETLLQTLLALLDFPKPLLCAVQARAIGAGSMIALAADAIWATDDANFTFPEIGFGMASPMGATMLAARCPRSTVIRLIQGGERATAGEALAQGWIEAVHERANLLPLAITRARQWAAHAGPAHAGNKQWINRDLRAELIAAASEATRLQHSLSNRPSV